MSELKTTVREVTLYVKGARIKRSGNTNLEPGKGRLEISNLPPSLEADSVRARASGRARAKIVAVDVKKSFYQKAPPGKIRELKDDIERHEDEERVLKDEEDSVTEEIKHIDGLAGHTRTYAVGLAKGKTPITSQAELMDFFSSKRKEGQKKLRENELKRRELGRKIKKLKNELKGFQSSRHDEGYSAFIELEITNSGSLEVELVYTIGNAEWEPLYDIRLVDSELEITYLAHVTQTSGEDWSDVELALSTVAPSPGTTKPELDPWYVSPITFAPPKAAKMAAGQPVAAAADDTMMLSIDEALEEPMEEAEYETAEISRSGVSITYRIPGHASIPGDGSSRKVTIDQLRFPPRIDYVMAPKIETRAFRRVTAENESQLMLLPGMAQIFESEDYIGKTRLKTIAPGEELKLYCGNDDRFKVERKLVKRETDKKFLKDKRRIQFAYEIRLENHTGDDQAVTVKDQIPLPLHEDIKVKLEKDSPAVTEKDEMNRLKWKTTLSKKDKKKIRYDFSVEYPRDMQIRGLP